MADTGAQRRQMAALLHEKTDQILEDWKQRVRRSVPEDRELSESVLRNSLHLLLENLARALEDDRWNYHAAKNVQIALEHARQRFAVNVHGFDQLVDEYAELRKAVVCSIAGDAHSTAEGVEVIHEFIDASIKHASGLFAELTHRQDKKNLIDEKQSLSQELAVTQDQRDGFEQERDSSRGYATGLEDERRLRSQVISMLGHDMRNPLGSALLLAQMMVRSPKNTIRDSQRLKRIVESLQRLEAMIQNLLDADKLSTGQPHPIDVAFCNLTEVLDETCNNLIELFGSRFIADIPAHVTGYWDGRALRRVIENLSSNAIKYGSVTAPVLLRLKKGAKQVELSVHNEGRPIPTGELPRLFEPHFRTDEAERSKQTGWGLGLACVKAIAEAHGGNVAADSSMERGTTFYVRLPLDSRGVQPSGEN